MHSFRSLAAVIASLVLVSISKCVAEWDALAVFNAHFTRTTLTQGMTVLMGVDGCCESDVL